jgi:UDP-N-acetylmuramoyl-tripeptide--D-alanyl-D-alanine ligase
VLLAGKGHEAYQEIAGRRLPFSDAEVRSVHGGTRLIMLDLQTAAHALAARHTGPNVEFTGVSTDTRSIRSGDLFVALRGERFDGHAFLDAAFAAGAVAAMVDERAHVVRAQSSLLTVTDTRLALGRLAATWRERFTIPVIAVTGSNGKTTVKEMLAAVLREAAGEAGVLATVGNLNNDIGMPLTLLQLRSQHRFAVIEMGMNHLGEIRYLTQLARPTWRSSTTPALRTSARSVRAKRSRVARARSTKACVRRRCADECGRRLRRALARDECRRRVIDFGIERPAAISAQYEMSGDGTLVTVRTPERSIWCASACRARTTCAMRSRAAQWRTCSAIRRRYVTAGLANYAGTSGRLQRKRFALRRDLHRRYLQRQSRFGDGRRSRCSCSRRQALLVLGDMGELGEAGEQLHAEVGAHARRAGVDQLFTLGDAVEAAANSFGPRARHFQDLDALCAALDRRSPPMPRCW